MRAFNLGQEGRQEHSLGAIGRTKRGCPQTLVLVKLNPAITVPRGPGPGAMRKVDWQPTAEKWLKDRRVILHSDSAKSCRLKVAGVLHDAVVHPKERVMKAGKYVWKNPTYVKMCTHQLPDGRKVKIEAGTQIIDRASRFIKERLKEEPECESFWLPSVRPDP